VYSSWKDDGSYAIFLHSIDSWRWGLLCSLKHYYPVTTMTHHHIPEECNPQLHLYEKLNTYIICLLLVLFKCFQIWSLSLCYFLPSIFR
jgi:hypothetical protein